MKKRLLAISFIFSLGANSLFGQDNTNGGNSNVEQNNIVHRTCATPIPDDAWEEWFSKKVEEFIQDQKSSKSQLTNYTIPVVFHILHNGDAVGKIENISAAQVQSQITALNKDYSGTGSGTIPTVFQSVKSGNTGIQFCLALRDVSGNTLAEPGIERINWSTKGWTDPSTQSSSGLISLFNNTIKPASIWDPTKYLNIWVCDATASGLLGFATIPAGSTLSGMGSGVETNKTSGVVLDYTAVGTTGAAQSPYKGGRTAVHEIGHWLGLRHISGDAPCGDDYCADTPPQNGGYAGGQNGLNYGCPTAGYSGGTAGLCSGNTKGQEMFMNFMDYCDDACLTMFTLNQATRMQTAMANGTYRKLLGTHGLCSPNAINDATILADHITVSPNPSKGDFNVSVNLAKTSDLILSVSNTLGQELYQKIEKSVNNTTIHIDLNGFTGGVYFISIVNNNGEKAIKKIIIE